MRRLITGAPEAPILDVAQVNPPVTVDPALDQEEVARLIRRHDLLAIPVVDRRGHVLGIVTVDDVLDALIAESTEDVHKFGGMEALDKPYMQIGFGQMIKKRAGWLSVLFLGEMLTASAMQHFEDELSKAVVLTLFIPLIMSSGGNSGSQATSLLIRSLALRELRLGDWWKVALRELPTGLTLGAILGVLAIVHHHLADRRPVRLRPALADGGIDHRRGADRHRHLRFVVRLDAAVRVATLRLRPGKCFGAICCDVGGRHRLGDLFQHRCADLERHAVVASGFLPGKAMAMRGRVLWGVVWTGMLLIAIAQAGRAEPAQPAACSYDRTAMLALDQDAFDQDLQGGWRTIADRPGCTLAAADLLRDYRQAHAITGGIVVWHEGQMRAEAGQTAQAIACSKILQASRRGPRRLESVCGCDDRLPQTRPRRSGCRTRTACGGPVSEGRGHAAVAGWL